MARRGEVGLVADLSPDGGVSALAERAVALLGGAPLAAEGARDGRPRRPRRPPAAAACHHGPSRQSRPDQPRIAVLVLFAGDEDDARRPAKLAVEMAARIRRR